ncbi:MAG: rRNA (cytosine967-C5)-methyltransferase [Frankiaceae bacterium]|nr:rRNA (cytosine967-C5)-methyltransferase [Frankiaceae bacterium]
MRTIVSSDRRRPPGAKDLPPGGRAAGGKGADSTGGERGAREIGSSDRRPRRLAFEILRWVDERDAYANLVVAERLGAAGFEPRDSALVTELVYGTLRMRGILDAVLARGSSRPLDRIDAPALDVLRLGAYQLLFTRIPPHAAVAETVAVARVAVNASVTGFVNAVLRRVAEKSLDEWLTVIAPPSAPDRLGHLALVSSHPRWIAAAFADALGGDLAETQAALDADNERPAVHLAARPGETDRDSLLAGLGHRGSAGPYSPYAVHLTDGAPGDLASVRDHRVLVQDEGSQLAALALARASIDGDESRWLDMAAGPGGKAVLLAGLAAERGISLLASDVAPHRARLVADNLAGRPSGASVISSDGRRPAWRAAAFDRVLLDAPCTGLGALRRRPEARWRRDEASVPALATLQRELLASAIAATRPGGVVGYVTCSPHIQETVDVIGWARATYAGVDVIDVRPLLPGVPHLGPGPWVQLWPHRHGTDAMFIALLSVGTHT